MYIMTPDSSPVRPPLVFVVFVVFVGFFVVFALSTMVTLPFTSLPPTRTVPSALTVKVMLSAFS